MSKAKSVWESRFYELKHRLRMHMEFINQDLATESINAEGEKVNTVKHWNRVGQYKELDDLIKQAEYIETQTYF